MTRLLLLRSGGDEPAGLPGDVDVLRTHEIAPNPDGIAEAERAPAEVTWLLVSSPTTVRVMPTAFFARPFAARVAAGEETAALLRRAYGADVIVPTRPGAAGILDAVPASAARALWPRGSDADGAPVEELRRRGVETLAPIVYEKRPVAALDPGALSRVASGAYDGIAVSSLAALDVLLAALSRARLALPSGVRWGVIGPESARAFERYSLPRPLVPERPRLVDLLTELRKACA